MELKLKGKVKEIMAVENFDSGFSKRQFVITTDDTYPQDVVFELIKDKCDLIDPYAIGSDVEVSFNVRGNFYNGKYYTNIQAWKLAGTAAAPAKKAPPTPAAAPFEVDESDDNTPF